MFLGCSPKKEIVQSKTPFVWEGANLYFLLIDRFNNGNPDNDKIIPRDKET
jgi:alpha-amylase